MKLLNNGLPAGVSFKDIQVGQVLLTTWDDSDVPLKMMVISNDDIDRRTTYKGYVSFRCLDANGNTQWVQGDQVLSVEPSLLTALQ